MGTTWNDLFHITRVRRRWWKSVWNLEIFRNVKEQHLRGCPSLCYILVHVLLNLEEELGGNRGWGGWKRCEQPPKCWGIKVNLFRGGRPVVSSLSILVQVNFSFQISPPPSVACQFQCNYSNTTACYLPLKCPWSIIQSINLWTIEYWITIGISGYRIGISFSLPDENDTDAAVLPGGCHVPAEVRLAAATRSFPGSIPTAVLRQRSTSWLRHPPPGTEPVSLNRVSAPASLIISSHRGNKLTLLWRWTLNSWATWSVALWWRTPARWPQRWYRPTPRRWRSSASPPANSYRPRHAAAGARFSGSATSSILTLLSCKLDEMIRNRS